MTENNRNWLETDETWYDFLTTDGKIEVAEVDHQQDGQILLKYIEKNGTDW